MLKKNSNSRVTCETMIKTGTKNIDIHKIIRNTIKNIGYNNNYKGFDYKTYETTHYLYVKPYI